ncbi:MAG: hypothetical protein LUH10_01235 [Tannerellaceae bacterium]|nr:hypothetical protein [Tannerellaceae bacterium]
MKKKKVDKQKQDFIAANRRGSREAEIELHGKPVSYNRVHVSKKVYDRKKIKADDQRCQPYSFYIEAISFYFIIRLPQTYWK